MALEWRAWARALVAEDLMKFHWRLKREREAHTVNYEAKTAYVIFYMSQALTINVSIH